MLPKLQKLRHDLILTKKAAMLEGVWMKPKGLREEVVAFSWIESQRRELFHKRSQQWLPAMAGNQLLNWSEVEHSNRVPCQHINRQMMMMIVASSRLQYVVSTWNWKETSGKWKGECQFPIEDDCHPNQTRCPPYILKMRPITSRFDLYIIHHPLPSARGKRLNLPTPPIIF